MGKHFEDLPNFYNVNNLDINMSNSTSSSMYKETNTLCPD